MSVFTILEEESWSFSLTRASRAKAKAEEDVLKGLSKARDQAAGASQCIEAEKLKNLFRCKFGPASSFPPTSSLLLLEELHQLYESN